jgi:hypothetical protein
MSIKSDLKAALEPVLTNTHAGRLPNNPSWPAIIYEIATEKETGWTPDGSYYLHTVTITILSRSLANIATLRDAIKTAMGPLSDNNGPDDEGDASYEGDANVYGYFLNFIVRMKQI